MNRIALARPLAFDLVAVAGSLAAACLTPFVGLAVAGALTMRTRAALATLAGGWALNQAIGYGALGWPTDPATIARGVLTGLCAGVALLIAARIGHGWRMTPMRAVVAFVVAFAAYEVLLYAGDALLGETWMFEPRYVWMVARNDALWFAGLMAVDAVLRAAGGHMRRLRPA